MSEQEEIKEEKNIFSEESQSGSCCGPSAMSFSCCGGSGATEETADAEKNN